MHSKLYTKIWFPKFIKVVQSFHLKKKKKKKESSKKWLKAQNYYGIHTHDDYMQTNDHNFISSSAVTWTICKDFVYPTCRLSTLHMGGLIWKDGTAVWYMQTFQFQNCYKPKFILCELTTYFKLFLTLYLKGTCNY